jgi:hypothetical protein
MPAGCFVCLEGPLEFVRTTPKACRPIHTLVRHIGRTDLPAGLRTPGLVAGCVTALDRIGNVVVVAIMQIALIVAGRVGPGSDGTSSMRTPVVEETRVGCRFSVAAGLVAFVKRTSAGGVLVMRRVLVVSGMVVVSGVLMMMGRVLLVCRVLVVCGSFQRYGHERRHGRGREISRGGRPMGTKIRVRQGQIEASVGTHTGCPDAEDLEESGGRSRRGREFFVHRDDRVFQSHLVDVKLVLNRFVVGLVVGGYETHLTKGCQCFGTEERN